MTLDEMLKLPPGPELDRLVAERVMGWEEKYIEDDEWHLDGNYWCCGNEIGPRVHNWSPSTDIAAAWEVVEKIKEWATTNLDNEPRGFLLFYNARKRKWKVVLGVDWKWDWDGIGPEAETAPLAICRAALLLMEERRKREAEMETRKKQWLEGVKEIGKEINDAVDAFSQGDLRRVKETLKRLDKLLAEGRHLVRELEEER